MEMENLCKLSRIVLLCSFFVLLSACDRSNGNSLSPIINLAPTASFTATPDIGPAPLIVNFDASASTDSDGFINAYYWDFGDSQTGSGVTSEHTFSAKGKYIVTLTVTDEDGGSADINKIIDVTDNAFIANISGTVVSAAGSAVDSDVNDINADPTYISNGTEAEAQILPNPVVLGGYLNEAHTGPSGPSFIPGDLSDFFRITMAASQTITLNIADFATGDLDLYLYFDDGSIDPLNPDDSSEGIGQTEALTVPQNGNYVIEVYAYSGHTNYSLVVGQNIIPASADRLVLTDEFVPGDVIARFKDDFQMAGLQTTELQTTELQTTELQTGEFQAVSAARSLQSRAASLGLQAKAGARGGPILMGLSDLKTRDSSFRALAITSDQTGAQKRLFRSNDPVKQSKMDTLQVIKALRKRSDVLYAEPNYIRRVKQTPEDRYYDLQWHYPLINLPTAWDISTGSPDIIVAVVDTGVLLSHPDLQGQISADGGYDFIQSDTISQDGEPGIDANPNDPGDSSIGSSSFHGTHVSGTIAAATSFSAVGNIGVAGVAPGVKIMPLRALGNGGGSSYDIGQAVLYAAGLANDSGNIPANRADVINLSLGGSVFSQSEQDIFSQARDAGVIIVAAAGNESSSLPSYPAAYTGVISVSAVDINKQLAPYSNFGSTIDVAAPGGDAANDVNGDGYGDGVLSTGGDDSGGSIDYIYNFFQGTSMASPHVAGVVALMKSVYMALTPTEVDALLVSGKIVQDIGVAGRDDQFGHGMIDASKAVEAAVNLGTGVVVDNPFVSVSPGSLNFGSAETSTLLSVVNGGTGLLDISSVSDDVPWLTIVADTVDAGTQLGNYLVTVDRTGLPVGLYTANITITSSANSVTVPVIQQVVEASSGPDTGYHYIILVDADSQDVVKQWDGNVQNGKYEFLFSDVNFTGDKRFNIFAGTDLNNDGFICTAGEACGAYISRDQPKIISETDTHTGLSFISGFSIGLQNFSVSNQTERGLAIKRKQTR
jgi:serine protease